MVSGNFSEIIWIYAMNSADAFINLPDVDIERQFVKTFVIQRLQDRSLFELTSERKRERFFSRLAHSQELVLKQKFVITVPHLRAEQEKSEITRMLKTRGAGTYCYKITDSGELSGERCCIEEGIDRCVFSRMTILICTDTLAFLQTERTSGSPPRFILKAK